MGKKVTRKKPAKKLQPGRKGRSCEESTVIPAGVQAIFDELKPNIAKCYPISTCCAAIGLDHAVWEGYCARYPGLVLAIKRERAARLMQLQDIVESGAQGWQAASRALESLDRENWNRNYQASAKSKVNPLSRALTGRVRK